MKKREAAPIKLAIKKLKEELPRIFDGKVTIDVTKKAHTAEIAVKFKKKITPDQSDEVRDLVHNLDLPVSFAVLYESDKYISVDAPPHGDKSSKLTKAPLMVKAIFIKTKRYIDSDKSV